MFKSKIAADFISEIALKHFYENKGLKPPKKGEPIFHCALTLGSGLSGFHHDKEIVEKLEIPYSKVPNMPNVTVIGHDGTLIMGKIGETKIICFAGRVHSYEKLPWEKITFQVQLLYHLGVNIFLLTNAAGGIYSGPGSFMIINDHLRLMSRNDPTSSVLGENFDFQNERDKNSNKYYDEEIMDLSTKVSEELFGKSTSKHKTSLTKEDIEASNFNPIVYRGVYCWASGPCYETPSEILLSKLSGGYAAGMSTVPEVLLARKLGIRVCCYSLITNSAAGFQANLNHKEVKIIADAITPYFKSFIKTIIKKLHTLKPKKTLVDLPKSLLLEKKEKEKFSIEKINDLIKKKIENLNLNQIQDCVILSSENEKDSIENVKEILNISEICPFSEIKGKVLIGNLKNFTEKVLILDFTENKMRVGFNIEESSSLTLFLNYLKIKNVIILMNNSISIHKNENVKEKENEKSEIVTDLLHQHHDVNCLGYLYKSSKIEKSERLLEKLNVNDKEFCYTSFGGPSLPTDTEKNMTKIMGGDVIGNFSPSIIYNLRYAGMKVYPISTIGKKNFQSSQNCIKKIFNFIENKKNEKFENKNLKVDDKNVLVGHKVKFTLKEVEEGVKFFKNELLSKSSTPVKIGMIDIDLNVLKNKNIKNLENWEDIHSIKCKDIPNFTKYFRGNVDLDKIKITLKKYKINNDKIVNCLFIEPSISLPFESTFGVNFAFLIRVLQLSGINHLFGFSKFISEKNNINNLVVVRDHINFSGKQTLTGEHIPELGPRFNDMSNAYNKKIIEELSKMEFKKAIILYRGYFGKMFINPTLNKFLKSINKISKGSLPICSSVGINENLTANNYFWKKGGVAFHSVGITTSTFDQNIDNQLLNKIFNSVEKISIQL